MLLAGLSTFLALAALTTSPPQHVDTDGDGLHDGLEDKNHNGRVDPGETDPRSADSDGDHIPDGIEDADRDGHRDPWESSPLLADTDGDEVRDGVEDRNHNGQLDIGETSTVLPCVRWGADGFCVPSVPEPMMVDLVRRLGARPGELEANVLAIVRFGDDRVGLAWAPELELAVAPGWAVEVELPLHNEHLEAVKLTVQGTAAVTARGRVVHGLQLIGEVSTAADAFSASALYVLGARLSERVSMNVLAGPALTRASTGHLGGSALVSPSLFIDVSPRTAVGLEAQLSASTQAGVALQATPQVSWRPAPNVVVQAGAGARIDLRGVLPFVASRIALEL